MNDVPKYNVNKYDLWACIYVLIVGTLSLFFSTISLATFVGLFIFALPFIYKPEYFIGICFLFSTISYYFHGAYEGIYSIYTILLVIVFLNCLMKKNMTFQKDAFISIVGLAIIAIVSFNYSQFHYYNGLYKLLYILIITTVIGNFYRLDIKMLSSVLPKLAGTMTIGYLLSIVYSGSFVDGRLTVASQVNTNSFGMSCTQLATILVVSCIVNKNRKGVKILFSLVILMLAFLSGSRGALLAFLSASILIYILNAKRSGYFAGKFMKLLLIIGILCAVISPFLSMINYDLTRFSLRTIIDSGGSRRILIYTSIIPFIISNGYWKLGYGPGHDCSTRIIKQLIGWEYSHTHNTIIEAFGELGILGLIFTIIILVKGWLNINKSSMFIKDSYIIYGMLICIFIHGMSESYFCNISFWLLMAICRNQYLFYQDEFEEGDLGVE